MSAPANQMLTDDAVDYLRSLADEVIASAEADPVARKLAIGLTLLLADHDARREREAIVEKQLHEIVVEVARQTHLLTAAAGASKVTH